MLQPRVHLSVIALSLSALSCGKAEQEARPGQQPRKVYRAPGPVPESRFGALHLDADFSPDPKTTAGRSGGPVDADRWNARCDGWVHLKPNHVLVVEAPFPLLRVLAHTEDDRDTTLVVRLPNGRRVCNDDADGIHPIVELRPVERGYYRVWVGSFEEASEYDYTLGVSKGESGGQVH